jgi:hypothetical protein
MSSAKAAKLKAQEAAKPKDKDYSDFVKMPMSLEESMEQRRQQLAARKKEEEAAREFVFFVALTFCSKSIFIS